MLKRTSCCRGRIAGRGSILFKVVRTGSVRLPHRDDAGHPTGGFHSFDKNGRTFSTSSL
jgi:hypothetical protein